MSNVRINVKFIIGSDSIPLEVVEEVALNLSLRYGGLTLSRGKGMWAENGDEFGESYNRIAEEKAYIYDLSVTEEDYDLEFMQSCFIPAGDYAQWIHCEQWETTVNHFDVKELAYGKLAVAG